MILNKTVVVLGGEDGSALYRGGASWHEKRAVKTETGGRRKNSKVVIRIPTAEKLNISCGDFVSLADEVTGQPAGERYVITEICDNRRGEATRHYKLTAGNM